MQGPEGAHNEKETSEIIEEKKLAAYTGVDVAPN